MKMKIKIMKKILKKKTPVLNEQKLITKYLTKNIEDKYKKRDKQRTLKLDFNFKKEWDRKQKELKNQ